LRHIVGHQPEPAPARGYYLAASAAYGLKLKGIFSRFRTIAFCLSDWGQAHKALLAVAAALFGITGLCRKDFGRLPWELAGGLVDERYCKYGNLPPPRRSGQRGWMRRH
jgi:hypothetical protein